MAAALGTSTELSKPDGLLGVAAEYATESVSVARRDQSVGEVRDELAGRKCRCAEDVVVLGGYLAGSARARGAAEEPVTQRLWHRLPWLLVGLLGAMGATAIVGGFKDQLEANVLLAFFIPAVVYMADAVGTQTETVLIRALSAGITVRSVLRRELFTGLVMGGVIGAAFLIFALIGWGETDVAAAVALAMFASCSIATLVAMALPALFQRLDLDPAFGSGPLATVLQDLLSIAVYLAIVVAVVG